ncbi:unnamed protein product [Vitrella brassicaformis CCMP3155]|uniref:Uncharacterized protein n=1 Tax=Vitrella brassicaformis (strain CCMP3155) TaxID=1169540 RepID=A0A0G4F9U5_VITBC|nr:unnamed protein product [Vitrella brassicaformis CCMP3155]|eukprot:CEM09727.1 unnamed protein product [Vitrella brassicaformis CCMP3155]
MAFRYRREGLYTKSRCHLDQTGMRPYVDEFRWRVTDWHYRFWMGPTAHRALRKYQGGSDQLQYLLDGIAAGTKSAKYKYGSPTRRFHFRTAVPQVVPYLKSSNPFCPVTPNKTGWDLWTKTRRDEPMIRDHRHDAIGGTDPNPPIMPKYK